MLLGIAVGILAAVAGRILATAPVRPDAMVGLVLWVPSGIGLLLILIGTRRSMVSVGAFLLALATGWFGALVLGQVMSSV